MEDALGCLVIPVPGLVMVSEDKRYALEVHFPGAVKSCVVEVGEQPDGGRKVLRESDRPVKEVREFGGMHIRGGRAVDL